MTQAFNLALHANFLNTSGQLNADSGIYNTVNIANGGTNLATTPTNGQLLIGNGTGYTLAALTAGAGVSITNDSGSISLSAPAASGTRGQVFTSSGTFTVPSGVSSVKVTVLGGGGGGGAVASNYTTSSGGGGGGYAFKYITGLVSGAAITVTVGNGGASGAAGGTSSFGAYCSATGGATGASRGLSAGTTVGGNGGTGTGDVAISGSRGGSCTVSTYSVSCATHFQFSPGQGGSTGGNSTTTFNNTTGILGGSGGASPGTGNDEIGPNRTGIAALLYGNGGSGAFRWNATTLAGAGSNGIVIVEW